MVPIMSFSFSECHYVSSIIVGYLGYWGPTDLLKRIHVISPISVDAHNIISLPSPKGL